MKICGKQRRGKPKNTSAPRKRTKPTKAENRLDKRIQSWNLTVRGMSDQERLAWRRPGSLKKG